MNDSQRVAEDEMLSPQDAWRDYVSLKQALAGDTGQTVLFPVSTDTATLIQKLVESGLYGTEADVIGRAIRTFFVAVFPPAVPERQQILREAEAEYHLRP